MFATNGALIDRFLPRWDVGSRHGTIVRASPAAVFSAVRRMDLSASRLVSLLFRLRGMPRNALRFEGLLRMGFVILGERPNQEIVLGLAGRFWTPSGDLRRLAPDEFVAFDEPGTARAVWGFRVDPAGPDTARLVTETRVLCSDQRTRRLFKAYWLVVGPLSGFIRRKALRLIRRDAERGVRGS